MTQEREEHLLRVVEVWKVRHERLRAENERLKADVIREKDAILAYADDAQAANARLSTIRSETLEEAATLVEAWDSWDGDFELGGCVPQSISADIRALATVDSKPSTVNVPRPPRSKSEAKRFEALSRESVLKEWDAYAPLPHGAMAGEGVKRERCWHGYARSDMNSDEHWELYGGPLETCPPRATPPPPEDKGEKE